MIQKKGILFILAIFTVSLLFAQKNNHVVQVNKQGRMVWKDTKQEAFFWGVNYTAPFAHAFRQIARVGEDRKKVIDEDTYHLARLGINAYRIHVWDCEISDSLGNILDNEHLDLLDYLIFQFQQRGVYTFLTPIAYWGNGYPERDEKLPGFSGYYNKGNVYTEPAAIAAQERYLKQFISHVNPYTGKAYKDDPMIVGFEVCNEPGHSKAAETTAFVKKMITAIHSTGCKKPVFYNVTQSINLLDDFIKGGTDGVTFQWYPTGLVSGHEQQGNFLPQVDKYNMPFKDDSYFTNQARLVYEFDAADIGRSYMYPPIALSFKEAGMQWVSMFAYDPIALAASNTEYQTHFLNLAYAPQKAIGFKIAGELFRNPKYQRDRVNEKKPFDIEDVVINYQKDLSELSTDKLFYYTNNTSTKPKNPAELRSIAGYGTSPIVSYKGRGSYFLDKINNEVWRLEVMPDAIWVRDPFSHATPHIQNVVIKWNNNDMEIDLPDLGSNFSITGINKGNDYTAKADQGKFTITPGTYLLSDSSVTDDLKKVKIDGNTADEFVAPKETIDHLYFLHTPVEMVSEGQPVNVSVDFVAPDNLDRKLTIQVASNRIGKWRRLPTTFIPMGKTDSYHYQAIIPDSLVKQGTLTYVIKVVDPSGKETIFPGGVEGPTTKWDYYNPDSYDVKIISTGSEVQLFYAGTLDKLNTFSGNFNLSSSEVISGVTGEKILKFEPWSGRNFPRHNNPSEVIYAFDNFVGNTIDGISKYATNYSQLVINGKAASNPVVVEVSLINKNGNAYAAKTTLTADQTEQTIHLKDLSDSKMILLPRPYPGFLPLWYTSQTKEPFALNEIERIQFIVPQEENDEMPSFELKSIILK